MMTRPDFKDGDTWEYNYIFDGEGSPKAANGDKVGDRYTKNGQDVSINLEAPLDDVSADILSHTIPSRTNAMGQKPTVGPGSVIKKKVDFERIGKSSQGHSAQYHSTLGHRQDYWYSLLTSFELLK